MLVLSILAVVTFILGLLFIGGQKTLKKLDNLMNKTVIKFGAKEISDNKERIVGVLLIGFSIALLVIGLSLKQ